MPRTRRPRPVTLTLDDRLATLDRIVAEAVPTVQRLALLERKRAARELWFIDHRNDDPPHPRFAERWLLHTKTDAPWVHLRVAFMEAARLARIQAVAALEIAGEEGMADPDVGERIREAVGLDYRNRGTGEASYRRQWAAWFRVNEEPCPF